MATINKHVTGAVFASIWLGGAGIALAGGWGPTTNITGYYVWSSSFAAITTSNNQNPDGCTNSHYLILDQTQVLSPFPRRGESDVTK